MRQGTMQTNIDSNNRNTMVTERKTISIMKACELVGVSRRTIYNWIAGGKVEYVRTAGGSVRIFVDTLWREPARGADLSRKEAS
jgi:excisionase family DNA binding protein